MYSNYYPSYSSYPSYDYTGYPNYPYQTYPTKSNKVLKIIILLIFLAASGVGIYYFIKYINRDLQVLKYFPKSEFLTKKKITKTIDYPELISPYGFGLEIKKDFDDIKTSPLLIVVKMNLKFKMISKDEANIITDLGQGLLFLGIFDDNPKFISFKRIDNKEQTPDPTSTLPEPENFSIDLLKSFPGRFFQSIVEPQEISIFINRDKKV